MNKDVTVHCKIYSLKKYSCIWSSTVNTTTTTATFIYIILVEEKRKEEKKQNIENKIMEDL